MTDKERAEILAVLKGRSFTEKHDAGAGSATTRRGDAGMTQLLFEREVPKWHPRIRLVGQLDTVSSFLNLCKAGAVEREKHGLVYVMGEVATHEDDLKRFQEFYHSLADSDLILLDELIQRVEAQGSGFSSWVENLDLQAGFADTARTMTRQAESMAWELAAEEKLRTLLARWLNRLADYLWVLSRKADG